MSDVVKITSDEYLKIVKLAQKIIKEKKKEDLHKYDNAKELERWITGLMGERAVEIITGLSIIEWEAGPSEKYRHPDMEKAGYNLGIKTIKKQNGYPLIPYHNTTPQIICIRDGMTIEVKGIATCAVLNTYQDNSLIWDYRIRGRKTAFTGFDHLTDVKYIDMFKKEES